MNWDLSLESLLSHLSCEFILDPPILFIISLVCIIPPTNKWLICSYHIRTPVSWDMCPERSYIKCGHLYPETCVQEPEYYGQPCPIMCVQEPIYYASQQAWTPISWDMCPETYKCRETRTLSRMSHEEPIYMSLYHVWTPKSLTMCPDLIRSVDTRNLRRVSWNM